MSMSLATDVDIGQSPALRTVQVHHAPCLGALPDMTPIAAYYVMIATEHETFDRKPRHQVVVPRKSLAERVAGALEALINLGRPTTVQPI
jgi:hypothetical protein